MEQYASLVRRPSAPTSVRVLSSLFTISVILIAPPQQSILAILFAITERTSSPLTAFISSRTVKVIHSLRTTIKTHRSFADYDDASAALAQIRNLTIRIPTWKLIASGVEPPKPPSSSSNMGSNASTVDVVSIVSELLSPEGIPRWRFDDLFLLCDGCERVMPRVGQANHGCMLETRSNDSEFDDDVSNLLRR